MSKNLILIISIFAFWLYCYLSNIAEEKKKEETIEGFADDGVMRTSTTETKEKKTSFDAGKVASKIINPVSPKYVKAV